MFVRARDRYEQNFILHSVCSAARFNLSYVRVRRFYIRRFVRLDHFGRLTGNVIEKLVCIPTKAPYYVCS